MRKRNQENKKDSSYRSIHLQNMATGSFMKHNNTYNSMNIHKSEQFEALRQLLKNRARGRDLIRGTSNYFFAVGLVT